MKHCVTRVDLLLNAVLIYLSELSSWLITDPWFSTCFSSWLAMYRCFVFYLRPIAWWLPYCSMLISQVIYSMLFVHFVKSCQQFHEILKVISLLTSVFLTKRQTTCVKINRLRVNLFAFGERLNLRKITTWVKRVESKYLKATFICSYKR